MSALIKIKDMFANLYPTYAATDDDLLGLTDDQRNALELLDEAIQANEPFVSLQGYAGTGKSYTLVRYLKGQNRPIYLTAPTNKATSVLKNMAREIGESVECMTIHRLLGLKPEGNVKTGVVRLIRKRQPDIKIRSLIIVDEASMIDVELLNFIESAVNAVDGVQVIYCGDPAQLPPVCEKTLPALSQDIPTARLTKVIRQGEGHPVLALATRIREAIDGKSVPIIKPAYGATGSIRHLTDIQFENELIKHFKSAEYSNNPDYCRVLTWTNEKSRHYNSLIRLELLGDFAAEMQIVPDETLVCCAPIIQGDQVVASIGDFVTVTDIEDCDHPEYGVPSILVKITLPEDKPDTEVYVVRRPEGKNRYNAVLNRLIKSANKLQGDCNALKSKGEPIPMTLEYQRKEAWRDFFKFKDQAFADLRPAHSSTIHRSQGSTYELVFVDLWDVGRNTKRDELLRLLYVALTRPRGDVIVTGHLPQRLYR